jgi:hypothetical protein
MHTCKVSFTGISISGSRKMLFIDGVSSHVPVRILTLHSDALLLKQIPKKTRICLSTKSKQNVFFLRFKTKTNQIDLVFHDEN